MNAVTSVLKTASKMPNPEIVDNTINSNLDVLKTASEMPVPGIVGNAINSKLDVLKTASEMPVPGIVGNAIIPSSNESNDTIVMKKVNKKKNSEILGNFIKQKFDKLNDTSDIAKVVFSGLDNHMENGKQSFSKQLFETIRQIVNQYMLLCVYANEEKFKRNMFTKIIKKSITFLKEYNKKAPIKTPIIHKNIGIKLYNIIVTQNPRRGGSTNEEDSKNPDAKMKCFVSDRTNEIIQSYFNKDIDTQYISEELILHLCKLVYSLYSSSNSTNQKQLCDNIDGYIHQIMFKTANKIIDFFPENTILETLYILLDDVVIQGFVKTISGNTPNLYNTIKEKREYLLSILNVISPKINNNIKSKPPVYFLEHFNMRILQTLQSLRKKMSGGEEPVSFAPTDYNVDSIIVTIADESYKKIQKEVNAQLTEDATSEVVLRNFGNYFDSPLVDKLENEFSGIYSNILHCLFATFNDTFYAHLFYVTNFTKRNTPFHNALLSKIPEVNPISILETTGFFGEYPFVSKIINKFKENTNTEYPTTSNTSITETKPSKTTEVAEPSSSPMKDTPQTGGSNFTIYSAKPTEMVLNNTIYRIIMDRLLQNINSSKCKNGVFNIIHETILQKIETIKPLEPIPVLLRFCIEENNASNQFIKKAIGLSLSEIKKNPKSFVKQTAVVEYILFVVQKLLHEYLYTNSRSTKINLQFNVNVLTTYLNTMKDTEMYTKIITPPFTRGGTRRKLTRRKLTRRKLTRR